MAIVRFEMDTDKLDTIAAEEFAYVVAAIARARNIQLRDRTKEIRLPYGIPFDVKEEVLTESGEVAGVWAALPSNS